MIRRDSSAICNIHLLNTNKLFEVNLQHNIAIFIDVFYVCDVITPEVEIGGHFRKMYLNGTLVSYNLDRYGFCATSKVTYLWTTILEYGVFVRNGYSGVALYILLTLTFKDR